MIDISNIINISVSATPAGIAPYSVSSLACFTKDTPVNNSLGAFTIYTNTVAVGTDWGTTSHVYKAALAVFAQSPNILSAGGVFIVVKMVGEETLTDALNRVVPLVFFGGFSYTFTADNTEVTNAATAALGLWKMMFVVSSNSADLTTGGLLYGLYEADLTNARCLFYTDSTNQEAFKWGYASRGMSTNFSGSNTTQTQNTKQIAGVGADSNLTATLLASCEAIGADVYANVAGRPTVLSYGANEFFDYVYNMYWFIQALQVAGFNALAQVSTKIPQTEPGMIGLKGSYRTVCEQAVTNAFVAPGKWTGADTFGDPASFISNIAQRGYYIYSQPISQQLPADRAARKAPLVQIAILTAGAFHSSAVTIFVNQ